MGAIYCQQLVPFIKNLSDSQVVLIVLQSKAKNNRRTLTFYIDCGSFLLIVKPIPQCLNDFPQFQSSFRERVS